MNRMNIAADEALACCACQTLAHLLASASPYASLDDLLMCARRIWWNEVPVSGWLEAFKAHPRIGDAAALRSRFQTQFTEFSKSEQSSALAGSSDDVFQVLIDHFRSCADELESWNTKYEQKFGHVFLIFASGKSAQEMLDELKRRCKLSPMEELRNAALEQMKITELRLQKVYEGKQMDAQQQEEAALERRTEGLQRQLPATGSHITSHVLDTALGCPAEGVPITLLQAVPGANGVFEHIADGVTNADGRLKELLRKPLQRGGTFLMRFDTTTYTALCRTRRPGLFADQPFYPQAQVVFTITDAQVGQHFHIPLLLSPFGWSTYRGS